MAPRTRNVLKRVRAVKAVPGADLADAQETIADKPASLEHRAAVPQSANRIIAKLLKAFLVKTRGHKQVAEVCVASKLAEVLHAKSQSGAITAPIDAEKFRRDSTLMNYRKAFCRDSPC